MATTLIASRQTSEIIRIRRTLWTQRLTRRLANLRRNTIGYIGTGLSPTCRNHTFDFAGNNLAINGFSYNSVGALLGSALVPELLPPGVGRKHDNDSVETGYPAHLLRHFKPTNIRHDHLCNHAVRLFPADHIDDILAEVSATTSVPCWKRSFSIREPIMETSSDTHTRTGRMVLKTGIYT